MFKLGLMGKMTPMLKDIYTSFNARHYSPERYQQVLARIQAFAGDTVMRMCETPVFLSHAFADETIQGAREIIQQALAPSLQDKVKQNILPEFRMSSAPGRPTFFIIDFAVTEDGPRLIEMQAFASNLLFIPGAADIYRDVYQLGGDYQSLLCDESTITKTILNGHAPENVVLMEINPWQQQSRRDFVVTQKKLGIPVIDVTEITKKGDQLFYGDTRIKRIYNRVIPTEFQSLKLADKTNFRFTDKLDVEWAGDPGWFLRISKYLLPFLKHPLVPETRFLDEVTAYPPDLENYVLKPVFLNAGLGVKINITAADLDAVPAAERHNYILMRKVAYAPFIPDLKGHLLNTEIRIMFVWPDAGALQPVAFSARVMHGNDVNANLKQTDANAWCGLAPVFIV
jgi:hypothetical protein